MFDAVVLAGGGKPEPLTEAEGVSNKAFISIEGKFLLAYVLQALKDAPSVGRTVVVGPEEDLQILQPMGYQFEIAAGKESMLENLAEGFMAVDRQRPCLVVTADIPLITSPVLEDFLALCAPHDLDLYYPVLSRETCLRMFPGTERTYVRLREGYLTGGNIGLLKPSWFLENLDRLQMFISYRKKPLKLMRILPPGLIVKYFLKKLSVADLERHISRLLGLKARAVFCDRAEIGVDVDKISDLELVRKVLAGHHP